ncbi:MAG: dTMP kinase [Candidatus Bathyarchaeia archaeon]
MAKGVFICVEGLDGCGKTTQTKLLVRNLRKIGYDAIYTAEPTRGKIGRFIRRHCLHGKERLPAVVEALLFAADRFKHVEDEVAPALEKGKIVVSDRYVYSSYAYQGAAGLNLEWIEKVNENAICPHLAIFVDVEPEIAVKRLKPKKSVMEDLETQRKVREIYLNFASKGKLVRIDGNKPIKTVATDILKVVYEFLSKTNFKQA